MKSKNSSKSIASKGKSIELLKGLTLLVVDDEPMIRKLVEREFSSCGCRVLEAENALDAAFLFQENHVDIVISDVNMSGGDGMELLKLITSNTKKVRPIMILMTGFSRISEEEAEKCGASALLHKPLSIRLLPTFVTRFLKHRNKAVA